jgi:predicted small integral membrane protein
MAWTLPTALFFIGVGLMLACLAVWELLSPTVARKGFLPMTTTRGDRVFISLLSSAYLHAAWLAVTDAPVYLASAISVAVVFALMRWG